MTKPTLSSSTGGSGSGYLPFPRGFLWGTATASHQVEGGNDQNDWWAWEQQGGRIRDGSTSGQACDHYRRYREDFELFASLGQNAHRLSLEWSRIEPYPGQFDPDAVRHYRDVLEELRKRGMEPVVTLHHFTNPRWLADRGGWETPEVVDAFARYVTRAVEAFGDLTRYWVTINEPVVYATMGYLSGQWPPGKLSPSLLVRVLHHMILAHARAARIIHDSSPRRDVQVGVAHHVRIFDPYRPVLPGDHFVARLGELFFNRAVLLALLDGRFRFPFGRGRVPDGADSLDFVGVNYYSREMATFDLRRRESYFGSFFAHPKRPQTAAGWEIYPEGVYRVLKFLTPFNKPILITENGVADERDELRPAFLVSHLAQIHRAMREGAPVGGYFHWSALDNFEWAEGLRLRFGLVQVDYESFRRTVKPSGELYARICAAGGITPAMLQTYGALAR
jgi:beta-glucosidase